jgi:hypothetical protein
MRFSPVLAAALLVLVVLPARAQEAPEESWSVMSIQGVRVGHVHSVRAKRAGPDGSSVIETSVKSRMAIKRMGAGLEINGDTRHVETPEGKPLRFSARMEMSSSPTLHEGAIEKGRLRLKTTTGGVTKEREIDWDPEWVLSEGARLLTLKRGFAPGLKYSYKTYSTEMGQADEITIEVKGPENRTVLGRERKLHKMEATTTLQKGVVITSWVDDQGNALVTETSMMGLTIVLETCTKEEAQKNAGMELPEIFFQTMPRSNLALPRPREIASLTVRMERPDQGFADWKPPSGTQSVLAREGNVVTLRVETGTPVAGAKAGDDQSAFLKPSPAVQCDDAEIVKAAREIAGDEKDPAKVAGRLASWVHDHIDKKSMNIGAASAREVFKDRSGDCSEHAVLLAAMFRAAGIPAKVCCGYLYFRGAWGGHAWTSAWLGRWVDFDATLGGDPADAARLKFSETEAEDAGALMEGMKGAGYMHGGMQIEILEFTLDGAAVKAAPPKPPAGDKFEAPLLRLSFEKPGGWSFADLKDLPPFTLAVVKDSSGAAAVVTYVDLPYDLASLDMKKLARRLKVPPSGELGKVGGCDSYQADDRLLVRISAGEVLDVQFEGDAARVAMERLKDTLKITR